METRARILAAAAAEFVEKGFAGATTRAIAARASINEVTLFRHFGTKQDLFKAVVTTSMPDGAARSAALFAGLDGEPLPAFLHTLGQRWLSFFESLLAYSRLRMLGPDAIPVRKRSASGMRTRLAERLQAEQAAGTLRPDFDPALAAEAFFQGLTGFLITHRVLFSEDPTPPLDQFLQTYVNLFVRGMEAR